MKKNYNQPQTEIVGVELANMILSGSVGNVNLDGGGGNTIDPQ